MSNEEFNNDNVPSSPWMKFNKIGDYIKGTLVSKSTRDASGDFKAQEVYTLTNCETVIDGQKSKEKEFNVGISVTKKFVNDKLKNINVGQRVGIKYEKDVPAKKRGLRDAKSFLVNVWGIDPSYKSKEVFKPEINFEEG